MSPTQFEAPENLVKSSNVSPDAGDLAPLPSTALLVAAMRAMEYELPAEQRRLSDPLAARLAGERGMALAHTMYEAFRTALHGAGLPVGNDVQLNFIAPRSAYFDRQLQGFLRDNPGVEQVVVLGAGMDTRAYRLNVPSSVQWYEIDYAAVLDYKSHKLHDETPTCHRIAVPADMAVDNWQERLVAAGFVPERATVWLAEGLLYYIPKDQLAPLLQQIDALSARGSAMMFDGFPDFAVLSARVKPLHQWFLDHGVDFHSSVPDTTTPLRDAGWSALDVTDSAIVQMLVYRK